MSTKPLSTMDLSGILSPSNDTYRVVIERHESGEEKTGFVIVGPDSDEAKAERDRQRIAGLRAKGESKKNGKQINLDTEDGAIAFDALFQKNMTAFAAAVTVDWFGIEKDGQPLAFNRDIVTSIYHARQSWRDRVTAENEKTANFLPKPAQG